MKKLLSFLLMLTLVFSMGTVAFAQENGDDGTTTTPGYVDGSPVTIKKALTATPTGSNPSNTFTFNVGTGTYAISEGATETTTAPAFGDSSTFTIDVAAGETAGTTDIELAKFDRVGVYTYPITETAGNTAGMTYDTGTYNLVITVINNPAGEGFLRVLTMTDGNNVKTDSFKNTFNAGSLTVKKETAGNYADPNDTFEVTVTLNAVEGKVLRNEMITASTNATVTGVEENGTGEVTVTYTVKKGSEFTINNIPYDVAYTVVEAVDKGYTVSYVGDTGTVKADNASATTTITNTRNKGIATGISFDNIPYILLLVGAALGLGALIVRKRKNAEY